MALPPKDPMRAQLVQSYPPAPPGMKKHYDTTTRTVSWVPKTPKELARQKRA